MIKVLSFNKISGSRQIAMSKEIANILELNKGDEVLFIIKNGIIYVRKFKDKVQLDQGEEYISSSTVTISNGHIDIYFPSIINSIINVERDDNILWLTDNYRNIMLRNTVLLDKCSKEIFNKNISALIIDMTTLTRNNILTIPFEIINILGIYEGEKIILSIDTESNNFIVSRESGQNTVVQEAIVYCGSTKYNWFMQLRKDITEFFNMDFGDKFLWIFDENGNIFMRDAVLPDICLQKI